MASLSRRSDQPYMTLRDAMNQLFTDNFVPSLLQGTSQAATDSLPVNVHEDNERFYVHMLAPGVDPQAVDITAANGVLSISGHQQALSRENWRPVWQEFTPGEFRRQLRLPSDIDAGSIEATYQNGVLMVTVPKAEHIKPKTIKVQVGK
jgi:HSP20 family protein